YALSCSSGEPRRTKAVLPGFAGRAAAARGAQRDPGLADQAGAGSGPGQIGSRVAWVIAYSSDFINATAVPGAASWQIPLGIIAHAPSAHIWENRLPSQSARTWNGEDWTQPENQVRAIRIAGESGGDGTAGNGARVRD